MKLKALADEQKFNQKIPQFYMKYDVVAYKGAHIYFISQLVNGALAMSVVKDKLIVANSLNAAKRGLDQMSAPTNILTNKDFIADMARVAGKPFDPDNLPLSFAYSVDKGSGGGVLLVAGLAIAAETAALAGISEIALKGQELNPDDPDNQLMDELAELTKTPAGRTTVKILNGVDLNRWPDEEFFALHRQSHAAIGMKTAKGWFQRSEFPPPMPHYGSLGAVMPIALVAIGMASFYSFRAQNAVARAQMNAQRQAMVQAQAQAQVQAQAGAGGGGTDLQQLHLAITLYETDHNALPTNPADLFPKYVNDLAVFKNANNPQSGRRLYARHRRDIERRRSLAGIRKSRWRQSQERPKHPPHRRHRRVRQRRRVPTTAEGNRRHRQKSREKIRNRPDQREGDFEEERMMAYVPPASSRHESGISRLEAGGTFFIRS